MKRFLFLTIIIYLQVNIFATNNLMTLLNNAVDEGFIIELKNNSLYSAECRMAVIAVPELKVETFKTVYDTHEYGESVNYYVQISSFIMPAGISVESTKVVDAIVVVLDERNIIRSLVCAINSKHPHFTFDILRAYK